MAQIPFKPEGKFLNDCRSCLPTMPMGVGAYNDAGKKLVLTTGFEILEEFLKPVHAANSPVLITEEYVTLVMTFCALLTVLKGGCVLGRVRYYADGKNLASTVVPDYAAILAAPSCAVLQLTPDGFDSGYCFDAEEQDKYAAVLTAAFEQKDCKVTMAVVIGAPAAPPTASPEPSLN